MKLYRVTEDITLEGFTAGRDLDNYVGYDAGDIVVVEFRRKDGVAEVVRLSDELPQSIDFDSLELIGRGLKLTDEMSRKVFE
jgi:hypothetical protein